MSERGQIMDMHHAWFSHYTHLASDTFL